MAEPPNEPTRPEPVDVEPAGNEPLPPDEGAREPDDSPQRRLVQTVAAYEVDPPPPARAVRD